MIKVVLVDIDNTLLSFTGYVKEAMREGFSFYGLKHATSVIILPVSSFFHWKCSLGPIQED